ncbi:MAG: hypothetical protein KJO69_06685 [Gammaproteobacteria bacterium]|nr:hypothetical protein [Gammaproteobacteria bacterium]
MYYNPTTCHVCHKEYNVGVAPHQHECPHCKADKELKEKTDYLNSLSRLELYVRIAKLEEMVYDLQRRKPQYVPPPLL